MPFSEGVCSRLMKSVTDNYRTGMCMRGSGENPSVKNEKVQIVMCGVTQ